MADDSLSNLAQRRAKCKHATHPVDDSSEDDAGIQSAMNLEKLNARYRSDSTIEESRKDSLSTRNNLPASTSNVQKSPSTNKDVVKHITIKTEKDEQRTDRKIATVTSSQSPSSNKPVKISNENQRKLSDSEKQVKASVPQNVKHVNNDKNTRSPSNGIPQGPTQGPSKAKPSVQQNVPQVNNDKNTRSPSNGVPQGPTQGPSKVTEVPITPKRVTQQQAQPVPPRQSPRQNDVILDVLRGSGQFLMDSFPGLTWLGQKLAGEIGIFLDQLKKEPLLVSSLFVFLTYYMVYFILYCGFLYECPCRRCA